MRRLTAFLMFTLLATACGRQGGEESVAGVEAPAAATQVAAAEALQKIFEDEFEDMLRRYPIFATDIGDHRYDDRIAIPMSPDFLRESRAGAERHLAAAEAIDAGDLDAADRLSRDVFLYLQRTQLRRMSFPAWLLPFDQFNSFPNDFAALGAGAGVHPFASVANYENFISRMVEFRQYAEVAVARFEEGVAEGVVHPRMVVERIIPQLAAQLVDNPEDSVFWQPLTDFPEAIDAVDRDRLTAAWREALTDKVIPAYRLMHDYLAGDYLAAARPTVGWSALPAGDAWYASEIAYHTTTDLDADAIHDIGLAEVARILGEMEGVRRRVQFDGDLAAFFVHLKTDDRFFWGSADEMLADYRGMDARVEAIMPSQFSISPRAGFEIRPIEPYRAASAPGAEYRSPSPDGSRPGVFYLNTSDLRRMPRWGMATLFLHEAVPGHHFQGAIARELTGVPRFRRFGGFTVYAEGWALYAEDIGVELGLLEDPYQYFGKLNDEMLRAMRLVVDTGLHRKGWSREQAIVYMRENSSLPEAEIVAEVERYIAYPAQALSYKTGQLALHRLKAAAEAALGDDFDIREWHSMVLDSGELPLASLQALQQRWLAARR
jgi:uncharacterized protein (DUF885 family)